MRLYRSRFFRDDPNLVVQYLHEAAADVESRASCSAKPQRTVSQQRHQWCVTGQYADLSVVRRRDDRIRFSLEQHRLRRDHRYLEHLLRVGETLRGLGYAIDRALHEERLLGILIELASHEPLER